MSTQREFPPLQRDELLSREFYPTLVRSKAAIAAGTEQLRDRGQERFPAREDAPHRLGITQAQVRRPG